jgi:hypothetical protein
VRVHDDSGTYRCFYLPSPPHPSSGPTTTDKIHVRGITRRL